MVLVLIVVFIIIVTASDVVFGRVEIEAVGGVTVVFLNIIDIKIIIWSNFCLPKQKEENSNITKIVRL